MEEQDESFLRSVESQTLAAIGRGVNSYSALLLELGAVYPSVLLAGLERLANRGAIAESLATAAFHEARQPSESNSTLAHPIPLPVPHPLDFDWRFSAGTVELLLEHTRRLGAEGPLVCLGSPTVFRAAVRERPRGEVFLVDANGNLLTRLDKLGLGDFLLKADLTTDSLPNLRAGSIVADPPWYPEYIRAFLVAARSLGTVNSRIWLSVPAVGTRPGVEEERAELLRWTRDSLRLRLVGEHARALMYSTPPFERNALRAEGILTVPEVWRRGDLLVFECTGADILPPVLAEPERHPEWTEVDLTGVRVRFRERGDSARALMTHDPRLLPLIDGDILPTVSRRDSLRNDVQIWTSGNRIFRCGDVALLRAIAETCLSNGDLFKTVRSTLGRLPNAQEMELASQAETLLCNLVSTEQEEYGAEWRG